MAISWHSTKVTACFPSLAAALFFVKQVLKNSTMRVICCLGVDARPQKYLNVGGSVQHFQNSIYLLSCRQRIIASGE